MKIKILYLIPDLRKGGAERFVADMLIALSKRDDVEMRLATFNKHNEYQFITKSLPITILNSKYQVSVFGKSKIEINDYEQLIQDFQPQIIHTHLFAAEFFSASKVFQHISYVTHGHDNMVQFNNLAFKDLFKKEKLTNYFEKQLLYRKKYKKNPTWIIANSKHTEEFYKKVLSNNMKNKVKLLPLGFNYQLFFKQEKNKISDKLKLINVGSFQDKKNQKFILSIAQALLKNNSDFEIHLLGDGQNRLALEQESKEKNLNQHIVFHGNVSDVEKHLHESHIYLHSAYYEPFGLVFLEAMAAGLPVVTLDGKGNRDIIEQGKNGYLFYEEDAELFAQTILELKNNSAKYQQISDYAKNYAKQFDMEQKVEEFVEFYREIIK